jgi:hypothetical protein
VLLTAMAKCMTSAFRPNRVNHEEQNCQMPGV